MIASQNITKVKPIQHLKIKQKQEIVVDNFAGGGGASTGIEFAIGRSVDIAINHDPDAIAMHKVNHPDSLHYCESVWEVDPRKVVQGKPVALCWLSPDCKHFSKAKGGKPVSKNIRGLAWVAVRWAATVKPRVIMLENVEEFVTWGPLIAKIDPETGRMLKIVRSENEEEDDLLIVSEPGEFVPYDQRYIIPDPKQKGRTFKTFVNALKRQGYEVDYKELRACDYGAPTIRKRFFLIARCDGLPIVWPEPTHGDPRTPEVKSGKLKPWRTAAEIIDWSLPCPSIFERKKPLAENTMRRIARGIQRFVIDNPNPLIINYKFENGPEPINHPLSTITSINSHYVVTPFIARISQTGFGGDRMQYPLNDPLTTIVSKAEHLLVTPTLMVNTSGHPGSQVDEPIRTITTGGHHALVAAFLAQYHQEKTNSEARGQSLERPILTLDTSNRYSLVSAFLSKFQQNSIGQHPEEPIHTVMAGATRFGLVTSHLVKMRSTNIGQSVSDPLQTITAGGNHFGEVRAFLTKFNTTNIGQTCDVPLQTVTTKHRFGLVTVHGVDYQIVDIGMRMLEPRELFDAQGFPHDYVIDKDYYGKVYPKAAQVARCGNAVPPPFAEHLIRANLPELCGIRKPKQQEKQMSLF